MSEASREGAARCIQRKWRGKVAREHVRRLEYELAIKLARRLCSIEIQRLWRGYAVRKYLNESSSTRLILKWKWGSQTNDVYIAGDFSGWDKWKMCWSPCYSDHRIVVPRHFLKSRSTPFEFKFIVDGLWTCDGTLPMQEGADGSVNNVFTFPKRTSVPALRLVPFDKRATSFPRLPGRQSFRYSSKKSESNLCASHSTHEATVPHSVTRQTISSIRGI